MSTLGKYTAREQLVVMKAISRERGAEWARGLSHADYTAAIVAALVTRYGAR